MIGSRDRPEPAWMAWLAHKMGWLLALATFGLLARMVLLASGHDYQEYRDSWLFSSGVNTLLLVFLVIELTTRGHFSRVCVPCMASVPEDGGIRVQRRRWRWALRAHHVIRDRRSIYVVMPVVAMLIGFNVAMGPASTTVLWVNTVANLVVYSVMSGVTLIHRPLTMWCPWCRWDEGGDHEHVPDPVIPGTKVTS